MAKSVPPGDNNELLLLLMQMHDTISKARVLNGGFDRLEKQVDEIKEMQQKFNADFQNHVVNDERIEAKIDRLYDPEEGIYAKVNKTEVMLTNLTENVERLSDTGKLFATKLAHVEQTGEKTSVIVTSIQKVAGEDNKDLMNAVKTSKGFWRVAVFVGTALITAIGKLLWDVFVG